MGYFYKMEGFQFYFLSGCAFEILNIMDSANIKLQKVGTSIREEENSTDYMRSLLNILKRKFAYKLFLVVQAPRTRQNGISQLWEDYILRATMAQKRYNCFQW